MKKIMTFLSIVGVFLLTACGGLDTGGGDANVDSPEAEKAPEEITIGVSISTLNNPFFDDMRQGIQETAEEAGAEVRVSDAQDDSATQTNDIDDLITQGVDVLVINPVDSAAIQSSVENANSANIPVITLDRSSDGGQVLTYISSDNVAGGEMAAEFILEQIGENGKVVQLEGVPGASAANERGEGFNNVAQDNLDVIDSQSANFNRAEGLSVMEDMLQSHGDIQAVFAQNDEMALGALEAIQSSASADDIIVVGFDGNEDAIASVENGGLDATVAQQPYEMGRIAVETIFDFFAGESVEEQIDSPLELVQ